MTQCSREPEYILEENSERMHPFIHQSNRMATRSITEVVAELRLLSQELNMSVDILQRITSSVHALYQSVSEQE